MPARRSANARSPTGARRHPRHPAESKRYYAAIATYTPPPPRRAPRSISCCASTPDRWSSFRSSRPTTCRAGRDRTYIPIDREGSIDPDLLDDAQSAIQTALRNDGYWKAEVQRDADGPPNPARRIITFTIDRGKRYRVASVELAPGLRSEPGAAWRTPTASRSASGSAKRGRRQALLGSSTSPTCSRDTTACNWRRSSSARPGAIDGRRRRHHPPEHRRGPARDDCRHPFRSRRQARRDRGRAPVGDDRSAKARRTSRRRCRATRMRCYAYYASRGFQPEEFHVDVTFNETATEATVDRDGARRAAAAGRRNHRRRQRQHLARDDPRRDLAAVPARPTATTSGSRASAG